MRSFLIAALAVFLLGCNERDQADAKLNAGVALASARNAASIAWRSFSEEASKVTATSSRAALEEAKRKTAEWQRELAKVKIESPLSEAQAKAAREQMAKIEAALNLQKLQAQSREMVDKAIESGKIAKQNYDDASRQLAEVDEGYRNLKERLADARAAYDTAAARLKESLRSVRELSQ